ncbi:hypothetical protein AB0M19_35630 [Streptomyces sp. NPDC051920]|uniref:hypothetical protein n=1 Tax=Streptomyces sp. NPDC051920 TaxID=3155523 RepID=UPI003423B976
MPIGTTQGPASAALHTWTDPAEQAIYLRTVETCLAGPRIQQKLESRSTVTADAVRAAMATEANISRATAPCTETYTAYRAAADRLRSDREARHQAWIDLGFDLRSVVAASFCVLMLAWVIVANHKFGNAILPALATIVGGGIVGGAAFIWLDSSERSKRYARSHFTLVLGPLRLAVRAMRARLESKRWEEDLRQNGTEPVVDLVIQALLGDDPHSVLLPDNFDGLRVTQTQGYLVPIGSALDLKRKLSILEGGTIAVCGPRGAGKTTLLENALSESDFTIRAHVPAAYTPPDFLLSLFVRVCEQFITRQGFAVPEFTRISGFVRALRRLRTSLRRLRRVAFFGVPAAALVVLGSFATALSLWQRYGGGLRTSLDSALRWTTTLAEKTWQGDNLGAGLLLTLAGLLVWVLQFSTRWRRRLRALPRRICLLAFYVLLFGITVSLPGDDELGRHARALSDPFILGALLLLAAPLGLWVTAYVKSTIRIGGHRISTRWITTPAALCCLAGWVMLLRSNADVTAMFLDRENPARLLGLIAAGLLLYVSRLRAKTPEPDLVTKCRDQLYQLKTVQSTSAAVNPSVTQLITLGSGHTSGLSTIPSNFPELVEDFRTLLTRIAAHVHVQGHRTVISLDELDRLGSDAKALEFLREIKGILGVPHVYYLISVAEDVGAAFVRRGLPHRDATDSSLDDIVHVQPCTLGESTAIMDLRAPGLTSPYVLLAHALSGGIPRDLIRYGRGIMEMRERTSSVELTEISRRLILGELSDTLAGFRTLLGKQQWSPDNASVLTSYRELMLQLRSTCACHADALTQALERFSAESAPGTSTQSGLPEGATHLIHEASVYTYFALTLVQIFSSPTFDQRRADAAARGPAGHPQYLADTRLELAVSPYSARSLITEVRQAWSLRPVTTSALAPSTTIPAPRLRPCPLHQPT